MLLHHYKEMTRSLFFLFMVTSMYGADDLSKSLLPGYFPDTKGQETLGHTPKKLEVYDQSKIDSAYKELYTQFGALEGAIHKKQQDPTIFQENIRDKVTYLEGWLSQESQVRKELFDLIVRASDPNVYSILIKKPENKQILKDAIDEIRQFKDPKYVMSSVGEFSVVDDIHPSEKSLQKSSIAMGLSLANLRSVIKNAENTALAENSALIQSDIVRQMKLIESWPPSALSEKIVALQLLGAYYLDQASHEGTAKSEGSTSKFSEKVVPISNALRALGSVMPSIAEGEQGSVMPSINEEKSIKFYKIHAIGLVSSEELKNFESEGKDDLLGGFCMQLQKLRKILKNYKEKPQTVSATRVRDVWLRYRGTSGICACLRSEFTEDKTQKILSESDEIIKMLDDKIKRDKVGKIRTGIKKIRTKRVLPAKNPPSITATTSTTSTSPITTTTNVISGGSAGMSSSEDLTKSTIMHGVPSLSSASSEIAAPIDTTTALTTAPITTTTSTVSSPEIIAPTTTATAVTLKKSDATLRRIWLKELGGIDQKLNNLGPYSQAEVAQQHSNFLTHQEGLTKEEINALQELLWAYHSYKAYDSSGVDFSDFEYMGGHAARATGWRTIMSSPRAKSLPIAYKELAKESKNDADFIKKIYERELSIYLPDISQKEPDLIIPSAEQQAPSASSQILGQLLTQPLPEGASTLVTTATPVIPPVTTPSGITGDSKTRTRVINPPTRSPSRPTSGSTSSPTPAPSPQVPMSRWRTWAPVRWATGLWDGIKKGLWSFGRYLGIVEAN